MANTDPKIRIDSRSKYVPFERSKISDDIGTVAGVFGVTEAVSYLKDKLIVSYQYDSDFISGASTTSIGFKKGFRAISLGAGAFAEWRWLDHLTGYIGGFTSNPAGNTLEFRTIPLSEGITPGHPRWSEFSWDRWSVETSLAEWYKWGARKFHLHLPFGKVSARRSNLRDAEGNCLPGLGNQESGAYQPDQWWCTKHGYTCPNTGIFGNVPMPWLVDDVVDGVTSGFVPLFRGLITGQTGDLDPEVWKRLTGIGGPSAWFDPNDPIEVTVYNGSMNMDTFRRWRRWFDAGNSTLPITQVPDQDFDVQLLTLGGPNETNGMGGAAYARMRLEESLKPFKRAGMRIAFDALVASPGPIPGVNSFEKFAAPAKTPDAQAFGEPTLYVPQSYTVGGLCGYGGADQGWWKFFSEFVIPQFGKQNIAMEASASAVEVPNSMGGGFTANPYIAIGGINICTADEFDRAAYHNWSIYPAGVRPIPPGNSFPHWRTHYLSECGAVEYRRNHRWAAVPPHIGWIDQNGITSINGRYWNLKEFAEKNELRFDNGGGAYGSGLTPIISGIGFDAGERYLRVKDGYFPGYPGECIWGNAFIADSLSRYQSRGQIGSTLGGDPTTLEQDKTIHQIMIPPSMLRTIPQGTVGRVIAFNDPTNPTPGTTQFIPLLGIDLPNGFTLINGVKFFPISGVTKDFKRLYPTIVEFAKYFGTFKQGSTLADPNKPQTEIPNYTTSINSVLPVVARDAALAKRAEGIEGVLWLDPYDYDSFAGTGLRGISGPGFYLPTPSTDLPKNRLFGYLDVKIRTWFETFGQYPKYIAWNLTKYSGTPESLLGQFEMERYLCYPNSIPKSTTENQDSFAQREEYFSREPGITWENGAVDSERFINRGFASATKTSPLPDSLWIQAKDLVIDMLQKTKEWRNSRGLNARVGLYHFPFMPPAILEVRKIVGIGASAQLQILATGGWNDAVLPIQAPNDITGMRRGLDGWFTQTQTENFKKRVKLEFRKRYEPFLKECEVVFPEIFCRNESELADDSTVQYWIEWEKEMLNLAFDLKTIGAWDVQTGVGADPALKNAEIIPMITPLFAGLSGTGYYDYAGITATGYTSGNPITTQRGNLFDYSKMNYTMVDWVRDEYLRPEYQRTKKVDGMSVWRGYLRRGIQAMRADSSTYPGRTADRDWVLKWLVADEGAGATIDWSNANDVATKMKRFFAIHAELSRGMLKRFDRGQPRVDIEKPFEHAPFAAGWNPGYDFGQIPKNLSGVTIYDVVPFAWVGMIENGDPGNLRLGGDTGPLSGASFGTFMKFINKIPKGRRVLLPYFWHQDPISDQVKQVDYYKWTADGSTYNGILGKLDHEVSLPAIKTNSPWAYVQANEAKQSFQSFLNQCAATGAVFDYIADDGESWVQPSLGSNSNAFSLPFGPTGVPAIFGTTFTDSNKYVLPYYSWMALPDNRQVRSNLFDSRFSTSINPYTGMTFGGAIEKYYKQILQTPEIKNNIGLLIAEPNSADTPGVTAGEILQFWYFEGPTGISASTGPNNSVSSYAPPYNANSQFNTNNSNIIFNTRPWRDPWTIRVNTTLSNKSVSNYIAWMAQTLSLENLVMGDLYKRIWIDSIDGFTFDDFRKIQYSHYDISPLGLTEGVFVRDSAGHPHIYGGGNYTHINPSPTLYGELDLGSMAVAKYNIFPNDDFEKFCFIRPSDIHNGTDAYNKTNMALFTSANAAARSYIAMIRDLSRIRGILRFKPNSWRQLNPWIISPSYRNDTSSYWIGNENLPDDTVRTDTKYWNELLFHCLLSGTRYFNYFNPDTGLNTGPTSDPNTPGFTLGVVMMQNVFDEWRQKCEGYRVQPASNLFGDVNSLVDRINVSDAGGNHVGATGTVTSGGKILKYNRGKTGSSEFGAISNEKYLWRVTAAPQAKILHRHFDENRVTLDLPKALDLENGQSTFVFARTSGDSAGSFFTTTNIGASGGVIHVGTYSPGHLVILQGANGLSGIANSGAELRHASTANPTLFTDEPMIIGSGRPVSLSGKIRAVGDPGFSGDYFGGVTGSRANLSVFGFYDLRPALGRNGVNQNRFGMESGVCFITTGGSVWTTMVTFKDTNGSYRVYAKSLEQDCGTPGGCKYGTFVPRRFKIEVHPNGQWAKFFIDDELVDTVDADTPFFDGLTAGVRDGIKSGLPIGTRCPNGMWAGCAVRDVSLVESGGAGLDTVGNGPNGLLIESSSGFPMNLVVAPGKTTDAEVSVSRRGAWIKRSRTSQMPLYTMTPLSVINLPEGFLPIGTGFPANPDSIFTPDSAENPPSSNLSDVSDLRVIAAWKDEPIPFDPVPSGMTVTLVAYHPSGIKRVEASLNGGATVARNGSSSTEYGEFEFYIPPVSGALPPMQNLPKTVAGATYRHLHEIRAKIFPFTGGTRILGGEPESLSRYYTQSLDSKFNIKKKDTNETSFFIQNIDTVNDPKYRRVVCVNATLNDPYSTTSPSYALNIRGAILHNMNTDPSTRALFPDNRGGVEYLDVVLGTAGSNMNLQYVIPCLNDIAPVTIGITNVAFTIANPETKTVRITRASQLPGELSLIADNGAQANSGQGDITNANTSLAGVGVEGFAVPWSPSTFFGLGSPDTVTAYALTGPAALPNSRMYRLNRSNLHGLSGNNPLTDYGTGLKANSPSGTAASTSDWSFVFSTVSTVFSPSGTQLGSARVANCLNIGKIKIGGTASSNPGAPVLSIQIDRNNISDLGISGVTQYWYMEGVSFTSRFPNINPRAWAKSGDITYKNCTTKVANSNSPTGITHGLENAFGFSRYVIGCTAEQISNTVFSNANFVRDSFATGCHKLDKRNPSFFGLKSGFTAGSAQAKKNMIYMNTICSGDFTECIGFQRNETSTSHLMDYYDILYRGLTFFGQVGMADRFSGYMNNVHFVGITMPNAVILSTDYRTAIDNPNPTASPARKHQKVFFKNSRVRMLAAQPPSTISGQALANPSIRYFNGYGISGAQGFTASILPRFANSLSYKIRGIPWTVNTLESGGIPINFLSHLFFITDQQGIRKFGLNIGGEFGPTGNGYAIAPKGLTFASWTNAGFEPTITPRLSWVYSIAPQWTGFQCVLTQVDSGNYENKVDSISPGANSPAVFSAPDLDTFYDTKAFTDFLTLQENAPVEWMLARGYSTAADEWTIDNSATNSATTVSMAGSSAHWLNCGNSFGAWLGTGVVNITGTGASAGAGGGGLLKFVGFADAIASANFASGLNHSISGGLTIEDQYGNLYKIAGGFVARNRQVTVAGNNIVYLSGLCAGTPWTGGDVIGSFPRDWIFNGDALEQSAPLKLDINNSSTDIYRPWVPSSGGGPIPGN